MLKISSIFICSGSADFTVKFWEITPDNKFICLYTLSGHSGSINTLLQLDAERFVSGSNDNSIKIWQIVEVESTKELICIASLVGHSHHVKCLVKLDSEKFASGSLDNSIKIWKRSNDISYSCTHTINEHEDSVTALLLLPDGRLLSASNQIINILEANEEGEYEYANSLVGHRNYVQSLILTSDNKIISSSVDCKIKVWY